MEGKNFSRKICIDPEVFDKSVEMEKLIQSEFEEQVKHKDFMIEWEKKEVNRNTQQEFYVETRATSYQKEYWNKLHGITRS